MTSLDFQYVSKRLAATLKLVLNDAYNLFLCQSVRELSPYRRWAQKIFCLRQWEPRIFTAFPKPPAR